MKTHTNAKSLKFENPRLSICTPVYNDGDMVGDMIQSILDQDYENIEHILVNDGSKDNTKTVLDHYAKKHPDRIKVIHFKENKGACIARNEAASHATGKYLSFLPADAKLYPGMARVWVSRLEENPDYDFLYGGYTFIDEDGNKVNDYISQEFDPYFLETNNYIDGSFPLKRELFHKMGGWDPSIKSLQDWDFWLNAVKKHKAKGLYVADLFFETELPHPGGLSFDSSQNWLARTDQIKGKYDIPDREICVCSFGAPFHGKNTAKLLDADYKDQPAFKPHRHKMIYLIGGYYTNFPHIVDAFKRHDGLRVVHWIGSDVMQLIDLQNNPSPTSKIALSNFLEFLANNVDVHLCEYGVTKDELKQFGIKAKVVPLPPKYLYEPEPLPKEFTVGIYLPYVNKEFYYADLCMEIAKEMKDVKWKIFGDPTVIGDKDNIQHVGKVDHGKMKDFIKDCSAILRLTPHDGLPLSVCEFITMGRNAITSTPMPHVFLPKTIDKENVKKAIRMSMEAPLNTEGSKYYNKLLSHKKYKRSIHKLLKYDYKKYWEDRSRSWNIIKGNKMVEGTEEVQKEYLDCISKYIDKVKPDSILDIGCGNGNWSDWLSNKCNKYMGTDVSDNLIEYARQAHEYNYMQSNLLDASLDLRNFIKEDKFDLAFTFTTLLHIKPDDFKKAIEELKKVAKYGIFVEPIKKGDRDSIQSRQLHPELIRDILGKGKILQGVESSFVHNYREHFKVLDSKEIGARLIMLVDLQ